MSIYGEATYGTLTYGQSLISSSVADTIDVLLLSPELERSWLVRAYPRDASTSTTPVTTIPVYLSSDGHTNYPTDLEELQFIQALVDPFSIAFDLNSREPWGMVSSRLGAIRIGDPGWIFRSLCAEDWHGRQVDVYLGPRYGSQVQFGKVAQMVSRGIDYDRDSMSIILDDFSWVLGREVTTNTYGGTGGLDGDSTVVGKVKPLTFGVVYQIPALLIDEANLIYQIHDGAIDSISNVYVGGTALVFDTDVADIATATPASGEYATSVAQGTIKLGTSPASIVTVDAQGHAGSSYGYVEDLAGLIKLIITEYVGLLDPANIDLAAFANISSTYTAAMGHHVNSPTQAGELFEVFLRSAGAWAWMRPDKVLTIGRITDPDAATVDVTLGLDTLDDFRDKPWGSRPYEIPVWRVIVGYRRYPQTLTQTDVSSGVDSDLSNEYRYVEASDATVLGQNADARSITILTHLELAADAQTRADEQLAMRKVGRRLQTIAPRVGLLKYGPGHTVQIYDSALPVSPKKFTIVGVTNAAEGQGKADRLIWSMYG